MHKPLSLLFFFLFSFTISLSSQDIQIDLENPIIVQPDEIGHICTLDPTEINAHYRISSEAMRRKLATAETTANFEITFQNDCGTQTWPQEAREALEFATEIWEYHLSSSIPIRVEANWVEQEGNVLGSAGPTGFFTLSSAGLPNTVYSVAQSSALVEQDLVEEHDLGADMVININCNFDDWYFGTDANTPTGLIDLATVALHELGHGIGFLGTVGANNNAQVAASGFDDNQGGTIPYIYEIFAVDGFFNEMADKDFFPNSSQELYDVVTGRNNGLFFDGREAELANAAENSVRLYAPTQFQPGSSFSHVDRVTFTNTENALMRPSMDRAFAIHNPGPVFCGILDDMGWPLGPGCIEQLADEDFLRKPILAGPFNNEINQEGSFSFIWDPVNNANTYQIQISDNFEFTEMITDQSVPDTTFTFNQDLETSNTYFWRVRGLSSQEDGAWSNTWSFSTVDEAPDAVVLSTPDDEEEHLRPGFQLSWEQANRADQYNFQMATDPEFSNLVFNRVQSGTSFSSTHDLELLTTYYWRVRGINQGGEGDWSNTRSFTTIIERPETVAQGVPADSESQVSTTPEFTWDESERAFDYIIQVSLEDDFSVNIIETTVSEPFFDTAIPLENATIYFWRIRATNIGGESDWSNTWTFTTEVLETLVDNNYPNPFNTETTIRYQLSQQTDVNLEVFDIVGRRVATLVNEPQQPGVYFVPMNASGMSSGTYLIRFIAGNVNDVQKMTLVK